MFIRTDVVVINSFAKKIKEHTGAHETIARASDKFDLEFPFSQSLIFINIICDTKKTIQQKTTWIRN